MGLGQLRPPGRAWRRSVFGGLPGKPGQSSLSLPPRPPAAPVRPVNPRVRVSFRSGSGSLYENTRRVASVAPWWPRSRVSSTVVASHRGRSRPAPRSCVVPMRGRLAGLSTRWSVHDFRLGHPSRQSSGPEGSYVCRTGCCRLRRLDSCCERARRESNPRPKTFHTDIYMLVLISKYRLWQSPSGRVLQRLSC
jgi:hypothetical protein